MGLSRVCGLRFFQLFGGVVLAGRPVLILNDERHAPVGGIERVGRIPQLAIGEASNIAGLVGA
jgi:hypothetical protein